MKSGDWAHMFEPSNGHFSMCVEVIFSLSCLNWFSFKVDSILCQDKIFLDLNLSNSSMVFGKMFFVFVSSGKIFGMFVDFTGLCDNFERGV